MQLVFPGASMLYNNSKRHLDIHQENLNAAFREEQRKKVKDVCKLVSMVQNHGTILSVFPHPDKDKDHFMLRILIEWTSEKGYYFSDWLDIDIIEIELNTLFMKILSDIIKSNIEEWELLSFYRTDDISKQKKYNDINK
jgi:hypothetical protein